VRFPQVRHPGDFRAVFSLPLNGSIAFFVTPAIFKPGSTVFKNLDSRLKISGMTAGGGGCLNGSTRGLNQRRGNPPFSVIARSD